MSGGLVIDIVLAVIGLAAFFYGLRQGGFSAVLSLIGVLCGGYIGLWLVEPVVTVLSNQTDTTQGARFLVSLLTIAFAVVIGYLIGSGIGQHIRNSIRTRTVYRIDSAAGAVITVLTTLIIVWLIAVPVVSNRDNAFAQSVRESTIMKSISDLSPSWVNNIPAQIGTLINDSDVPAVTDPFSPVEQREVQPPDPALQDLPDVAAVAPSVVKIQGMAEQCSRMLQGTGFVVAPGMVMTNAHVVAGTNAVTLSTVEGEINADVVYYNPQQDIAVLNTRGELALQPLRWADDGAMQGDDAIVLGYPLGGPFKASPVRVRDRFVVSGPNIYANDRVEREAYSLRGSIVQGNSGGPMVSPLGEVYGLVFGADMHETDTGYALTRDEVFSHLDQASLGDPAQWGAAVDTEACVTS